MVQDIVDQAVKSGLSKEEAMAYAQQAVSQAMSEESQQKANAAVAQITPVEEIVPAQKQQQITLQEDQVDQAVPESDSSAQPEAAVQPPTNLEQAEAQAKVEAEKIYEQMQQGKQISADSLNPETPEE